MPTFYKMDKCLNNLEHYMGHNVGKERETSRFLDRKIGAH